VVEPSDSHTNLSFSQGTILAWYAGNWIGTNEGGSGPGGIGRLVESGASGSGWFSFCFDASGNIFFCGQTNGGSPGTYLSSPIAWTTNNGGWSYLTLVYSATNTALYVNGTLVTNGTGVTAVPDTNSVGNSFTIGSDGNGLTQAHGAFADVVTYDRPLDSGEVAAMFLLYALMSSPVPWVSIDPASSTNSADPFNVVTGSGNIAAGGTNAASCVVSTNLWFTNVTAKAVTNGTQLTFLIAGGEDGVLYDVFANSVVAAASDTNRPWAWMGQAYHCVTNTLTITNQPNVSAFLILGTPQDTDSDGLTDAYEQLVSKTNPTIPDTDGDGIRDGVEVQFGTNPLVDETQSVSSRVNFSYDGVGRLKGATGARTETITFDAEGNVTRDSQ